MSKVGGCTSNNECGTGYYCSLGKKNPTCLPITCDLLETDKCKGWFKCEKNEAGKGECELSPEKVIKSEIKLIADKINSIEDKLKHNPCANQHNFSRAFSKAYDSKEKSMNKITTPVLVYLFIHLIFLVWGIMLAFKQPLETRNVHITLAIVFSPAYVLAHYLSLLE
jgi:hypothetical protein